jgi:hypothetical protein
MDTSTGTSSTKRSLSSTGVGSESPGDSPSLNQHGHGVHGSTCNTGSAGASQQPPPRSPSLLKMQKSSPSLLAGHAHHAQHHGRGGSGVGLRTMGVSLGSGLSMPPASGALLLHTGVPGLGPSSHNPTPGGGGYYSPHHARACMPSPTFGTNLRSRSRANSLTTDSLGTAMASSPYRARMRIGNNSGTGGGATAVMATSLTPGSRGLSMSGTGGTPTPMMVSPRSCPASPAIPFVPTLGGGGGPRRSLGLGTRGGSGPTAAASAAGEKERNRAREHEKDEADLTEDQLRAALRKERSYSCKLAMDVASLKSQAVTNQAEAEVTEEGRINCLMKRLDGLSREKGRILIELEREEEMVRTIPCVCWLCF